MSKARDIADLDFNSPDIDGGNIDGATLGATTVTGTVVFNSAPTFNTAITMGSTLNVASSIGIAGTTVIDSNRNTNFNNSNATSFLSTNGYWVGGTRRIDANGNLENIGNITTTGNVGIGQSPTSFSGWQVLDIKGGSDGAMINFEDAASTRLGAVAMDTDNALRIQTFTSGTSDIKFEPNNAVALTLDSNQNATFEGSITCNDGTGSLVISNDSSSNTYLSASGQLRVRPEGTSINKIIFDAEYIHGPAFTTRNAVAGIGVSPGDVNSAEVGPGYITLARDDLADAEQIKFFKNGSLHSRLKTGNNYLEIYNEGSDIHLTTNEASAAKRINFSGSIPSFKPFDSNTGQLDLGTSSAKWKDLYLSGGAYLGGAVAANKLDFYEKGTWTPSYRNGGTVLTETTSEEKAEFRRIGDTVWIHLGFRFSSLSGTSTGSFRIYGLPFVAKNNGGYQEYRFSVAVGNNVDSGNSHRVFGFTSNGNSYLEFRIMDGGDTVFRSNQMDGNSFMSVWGFYVVA
tara:strand:- start:837 stop:2378 length:1542 start_codon:yes stop_codon:yes gene_type:complete